MKNDMKYQKYYSNGDLHTVNNHVCMCCKQLKNNTDIFVFDTEKDLKPKRLLGNKGSVFTSSSSFGSAIKSYENVFLCGECVYMLSQQLSEDVLKKIVADEL